MRKKHNYLIAALIIVLIAVLFIINPLTFLPHKRIVISAPYSLKDTPEGMMPMGAKVAHSKSNPGIDFSWSQGGPHAVLSSSEGKVTSISKKSPDNNYEVVVRSGLYVLRYSGLENVSQNITLGSNVQASDIIGYASYKCEGGENARCAFTLHWELASVSLLRKNWCPTTYLDVASRTSLEQLWNSIPSSANDNLKALYPIICNGKYEKHFEK